MRLTIENFSCIQEAKFEIGRVNIIIGKQASGKSLISKLVYFANSIIQNTIAMRPEETTLDGYIRATQIEFTKLFPPKAWGNKKFHIHFQNGDVGVSIFRKSLGKKTGYDVVVEFSDNIKDLFMDHQRDLVRAESEIDKRSQDSEFPFLNYDLLGNVVKNSALKLKEMCDGNSQNWQLFIPAGRSFFTSLGKALTAFERSGFLDPITMSFGEFFLNAKQRFDGEIFFYPRQKKNLELKSVMEIFFGGKYVSQKNEEFIETEDGRYIPLSFLSSGQQELLPLWLSVEHAVTFRGTASNIFIEEPEAHIFPATQSALMQSLVGYIINGPRHENRMFITTHSPYVLGKINNLIKAYQISRKSNKDSVEKILPKISWLNPRHVKAYAIENGVLRSIIDEEDLIDGRYIDQISSDISDEYMNLLECEK